MLEKDEIECIDAGFKKLQTRWIIVLVTLFVYALVIFNIKGQVRIQVPSNSIETIRYVCYLTSLIILISSVFVKKHIMSNQTAQQTIIERYSSAIIISSNMAQIVGILGLILLLIGDSQNHLYILGATSILAIIYYRPQKNDILLIQNNN